MGHEVNRPEDADPTHNLNPIRLGAGGKLEAGILVLTNVRVQSEKSSLTAVSAAFAGRSPLEYFSTPIVQPIAGSVSPRSAGHDRIPAIIRGVPATSSDERNQTHHGPLRFFVISEAERTVPKKERFFHFDRVQLQTLRFCLVVSASLGVSKGRLKGGPSQLKRGNENLRVVFPLRRLVCNGVRKTRTFWVHISDHHDIVCVLQIGGCR